MEKAKESLSTLLMFLFVRIDWFVFLFIGYLNWLLMQHEIAKRVAQGFEPRFGGEVFITPILLGIWIIYKGEKRNELHQ